MKNLIIAGVFCVVVVSATFAFDFAFTGPSVNDIERWGELNRQETEAAKSGNWEVAFDRHSQAMQTEMGRGNSAVQKASNCLRTCLYKWNLEEYESARKYLEECVYILKNSGYGNGCETRAIVFLNKMKNGKVSRGIKFTYTDISLKNGIASYIMEVPWALEFKKWDDIKRRYDTINRILDSQLHSARLESQRIEGTIKIQARQDFLEKHHETFDPNNRPSYNSPMREDWDACKRIYDIFD